MQSGFSKSCSSDNEHVSCPTAKSARAKRLTRSNRCYSATKSMQIGSVRGTGRVPLQQEKHSHFSGGRWKKKSSSLRAVAEKLRKLSSQNRPKTRTVRKINVTDRIGDTCAISCIESNIITRSAQNLSASMASHDLTAPGDIGRLRNCAGNSQQQVFEPAGNMIELHGIIHVESDSRFDGKRAPSSETRSSVQQRPRRMKCNRKLDNSLLSWQEENELKKALYASLQQKRKAQISSDQYHCGERNGVEELQNGDGVVAGNISKRNSNGGHVSSDATSSIECVEKTSPPSTRLHVSSSPAARNETTPSKPPSVGQWQIRAQRKFASNGGCPTTSRVPSRESDKKPAAYVPRKLFMDKVVTTEDFITFLCYRGSDKLPPHLKFFSSPELSCLPSFPSTPRESTDSCESSVSSACDLDSASKSNSQNSHSTTTVDSPTDVKRRLVSTVVSSSSRNSKLDEGSERGAAAALQVMKSADDFSKQRLIIYTKSTATLRRKRNVVMSSYIKSRRKHNRQSGRHKPRSGVGHAKHSMVNSASNCGHTDSDGVTCSGLDVSSVESYHCAAPPNKKSRSSSSSRSARRLLKVNNKRPMIERRKVRGPSVIEQTGEGGGGQNRSRRSTRSRTAAIQWLELNAARMKSYHDDVVTTSTSSPPQSLHETTVSGETASESGSDATLDPRAASKKCPTEEVESEKPTSSDKVKRRFLRRPSDSAKRCKQQQQQQEDDGEFVMKKFFKVPSATMASVTRSKVNLHLTFHPSLEQFQEPISYIQSLKDTVSSQGICCIVPPAEGWKVAAFVECDLSSKLVIETETQCISMVQCCRDQPISVRHQSTTPVRRTLDEFRKKAETAMSAFFSNMCPSVEQVERKYWQVVEQGQGRVIVETAHMDTSKCGSAFPTSSSTPLSKHQWNFNMLQRNPRSLLTKLGPGSRVNVSVLHVGMMFSSLNWSCNQHLLPSIYYLHTGADIVWYCIPWSDEDKLRKAISSTTTISENVTLMEWLLTNPLSMSPSKLRHFGVTVHRVVQKVGQFVVIFPQSFVASICCGYTVNESILFATSDWIPLGVTSAQILKQSKIAEHFSIDQLLMSLVNCSPSAETDVDTVQIALHHLTRIITNELSHRARLKEMGLQMTGQLPNVQRSLRRNKLSAARSKISGSEMMRCHICHAFCYLSVVLHQPNDRPYCLTHAMCNIQADQQTLRDYSLLVRYDEIELQSVIDTNLASTKKVKSKVE